MLLVVWDEVLTGQLCQFYVEINYSHMIQHRDLFFSSFFPCSADLERDWPPCKVVFFGLATNALNVRNNNNNNNNNSIRKSQYNTAILNHGPR